MSETRNFMALDWVKSEIEDTLRTAREALEAFADSPDDVTLARQCLTSLHQVNGTLQMVELHGAAGLAAEMENLAQALMNRSVADNDAALEALMEGILQLPSHLNRVHRGAEDDPRVHALLIDRMRAARGESPLTRREELEVDPEAIVEFMKGPGPAEIVRLRATFQKAMLALIRKAQPADKLYPFLDRLFTRLQKVTPPSPIAGLWGLAAGVMELRTASGEPPEPVLPLLRGLDHQLKDMADSPEATLSSRPPKNLRDGLAALVESAPGEVSPRIESLRRSLIPVGEYHDSGPIGADDETIASVAAALHEELGSVRDRLDLYVRGSVSDAEGLQALGADLQRVAGTLQVVGLDELRETIATQAAWVRQQASQDRVDEDAIMDVAGAVLFVDSALMNLAGIESDDAESMPGTLSDANSAVLREARVSLDGVKQAIVDFISSNWDHDRLESVPGTLTMVRSVLGVIPLERAAALVEACRRYVQDEVLATRAIPQWQRLDHLADAITSIDYFLERMLEDRVIPDPRMLEIAEESIAQLGQPAEEVDLSGLPADADPGQTLVRAPAPAGDADHASAPETARAPAGAPADDEPSALSEPVEDDFDLGGDVDEAPAESAAPRGAPVDDEPSHLAAPVEDDFDLGLDVDDEADEPPEEIEAAPPPEPADDLIDDEIIEIFLEEVMEVLEQIDAFAPAWRADPRDAQALSEIRRAYHTLKGSGRMVGATVLGELAWSVENMLNRVIDGTVEPTPAIIDLTLRVRDVVPVLRESFAQRVEPELDVSPFMERADVFASGGSAEDLPDLPEPGDPVATSAPTAAPSEDDFDLGGDAGELEEISLEELAPEQAPAAEVEPPQVDAGADEPEADAASGLSAPTEDDFDLGGDLDLGDGPGADPVAAAPEDAEPTLLDIFEEEAGEHLQAVRAFLERASSSSTAPELTDDLRRALHTLKGSAAMAGFSGLSALAAPLENIVRRYLELNVPVDDALLALLENGERRFEAGLAHLRQTGSERVVDAGERDYLARANELLARLDAQVGGPGGTGAAPSSRIFGSAGIDLLLEAGSILRDWVRGEVETRRQALREELAQITGHAREAGQQSIGDLAAALAAAHDLFGATLPASAGPVLERAHEALIGMLDALAAGLEVPDPSAEIDALASLREAPAAAPQASEGQQTESVAGLDLDPEMVEIFFEEADELLEAIEGALDLWPTGDPAAVDDLLRSLHTLKGGARMAGLSGLGGEAHDLETWIEQVRSSADDAVYAELRSRVDRMANRIAMLRRGEAIVIGDAGGSAPAPEPAPASTPATPPAAAAEAAPAPPPPVPEPPAEAPAASGRDDTAAAEDPADLDPEIVELFMEEAGELTASLDAAVAGWRDAPDNEIHLESLLRVLHTLKGGARMAGLMAVGEAAHDLETRLIEQRGRGIPDAAFFGWLQGAADGLSEQIGALAAGSAAPAPVAPPAAVEPPPLPPAPEPVAPEPPAPAQAAPEPPRPEPVAPEAAAPRPSAPKPVAPEPVAPESPPVQVHAAPPSGLPADATQNRDAPHKEAQQEMIRVSSGLLDDLVSLAGETSIMRGRVQQEISDFGVALDEMEATIERIQEQVRRLDSAAQEQILFRQEVAQKDGQAEDFDPLEMDRYTQLQELTRTLAESASDVSDLRETLAERLRTTDTLLLQQARINTGLQEGLMRTRMVPFARLLPRLKRIVRQVGRELGKPVELEVENAEGELDRNVLERMIAPLEHMLRNAVDHGLEKTEVRSERGKSPQGTIRLRLSQEGGEILIQVADDGGGINADGVRAKAVERGLLAADAEPTQEEILSFIMSPGFSTAKSVTQISGRGVGMDVVNSEVKQLGGSISIASTLGEGTTFTVRLPFTVSVTRALMLTLGDDQYAVPLNAISGIVRVPVAQLKSKYERGSTDFSYRGQSYQLAYLGELLGLPRQIREDVTTIPILMVRTADRAMAVHADSVAGSREIVVKSLGPQFAGFSGVSGATIMGDGSVVMILDLQSLLRSDASLQLGRAEPRTPEPAPRAMRHVMVVDDSVTVRKVTTRLLERKGFQVTVAKDGVEAVAALSETRPDLMLLDIEMPRMDGFEVATHVRNEPRLADLPIIMISSRTGDKHRERAESIGVNRFLGKPFQEPELLAAIEELASP